jgi:7-keto-8-aminopelargonate synthetase-like enzyme
MGTLGKALGSAGAYIAGTRAVIELVVNRARTFVYTTGIVPAAVAAASAALDLVAAEPARRAAVLAHADRLRAALRALGLDVRGDTQIVPTVVGENRTACRLAEELLAEGVLAHAIRPPTVPPGTARLRLSPMATHDGAHVERAIAALRVAAERVGLLR